MPLKSRYNTSSTGDVNYGHNVVLSIISLAAQEINGVAALQGKGVTTDFIGNMLNIDVYLNVNSDVSCSDLAYRVQENIKRSVESSMSRYKVGTVNVNILGVTFPNQNK